MYVCMYKDVSLSAKALLLHFPFSSLSSRLWTGGVHWRTLRAAEAFWDWRVRPTSIEIKKGRHSLRGLPGKLHIWIPADWPQQHYLSFKTPWRFLVILLSPVNRPQLCLNFFRSLLRSAAISQSGLCSRRAAYQGWKSREVQVLPKNMCP